LKRLTNDEKKCLGRRRGGGIKTGREREREREKFIDNQMDD
jgi:hypothetical protein